MGLIFGRLFLGGLHQGGFIDQSWYLKMNASCNFSHMYQSLQFWWFRHPKTATVWMVRKKPNVNNGISTYLSLNWWVSLLTGFLLAINYILLKIFRDLAESPPSSLSPRFEKFPTSNRFQPPSHLDLKVPWDPKDQPPHLGRLTNKTPKDDMETTRMSWLVVFHQFQIENICKRQNGVKIFPKK